MLKQIIFHGSKPSQGKGVAGFLTGFSQVSSGFTLPLPYKSCASKSGQVIVDGGADEPCAGSLSSVPGFRAAGAALLTPLWAFLGN